MARLYEEIAKRRVAHRRKKVGRAAQSRISAKIAKLRREGKTAAQAAGAAYGMEREGRLGPHGGYRRA